MDGHQARHLDKVRGAVPAEMPSHVAPMLATITDKPFDSPEWYFEPKLDGYRVIALIRNGAVKLQSRNYQDYTAEFADIAGELAAQPVETAVFDGELVALDTRGLTCFHCLQGHVKPDLSQRYGKHTLRYFIFDILYLDGYDLTGVELRTRIGLLDSVLKCRDYIKSVFRLDRDGTAMYRAMVDAGMEGVVAKRHDSLYLPGKRSTDWLKVKATLTDEFVVAGFTAGQGSRTDTFGSLVLGQFDEGGSLNFRGHVGTGFNEGLLEGLTRRLRGLAVPSSPFAEKIPDEKDITWVSPELVAEVKYAELTADNRLRAPVFLRLRDDKSPEAVTL